MKISSFVLLLIVWLTACAADAPPPVIAGEDTTKPVILVVGDSLSAGYGIELADGWVSLLQKRLQTERLDYNVINASVSGDTTSGGLARLKMALPRHNPTVVVIELGGNDGLRGIPLPVLENNLNAMIELSHDAGAQVALLGMRIPSNYGPRYTEQFHNLYKKTSRRYKLPFVDFFMEGVALDAGLMQSDGIHPNTAAQPRLLDNAWPAIEEAISVR